MRRAPAKRRNLHQLANRIVLALFHNHAAKDVKDAIADRLVLTMNDGRAFGGWGLGPARDVIWQQLRRKPSRRRVR